MEKYSNSGQRWSNDEHQQLLHLYNVKKLNVGEICKQHKRFLGGITSRLKNEGIISFCEEARGYNEFITSDDYEEMKYYQKLYHDEKYKKREGNNNIEKKKTKKNDNILITIKQSDYDELKEEITELKSELLEIKTMIKNLAIYDFD